jgi:uncharacterized membrane protein YidH (DUF202 family)
MATDEAKLADASMERSERRARLEPRWLYISVGALVLAVVMLFAVVLFTVGLFLHEANDAMAGF